MDTPSPTRPVDFAGYWYLATPYAGSPFDRDHAAALAVIEVGRLLCQGLFVFSPIAHNHAVAEGWGMGGRWDVWRDFDLTMLEPAVGLLVPALPGWATSTGVQAEIRYAEEWRKPVIRYEPGAHLREAFDLNVGLRRESASG